MYNNMPTYQQQQPFSQPHHAQYQQQQPSNVVVTSSTATASFPGWHDPTTTRLKQSSLSKATGSFVRRFMKMGQHQKRTTSTSDRPGISEEFFQGNIYLKCVMVYIIEMLFRSFINNGTGQTYATQRAICIPASAVRVFCRDGQCYESSALATDKFW